MAYARHIISALALFVGTGSAASALGPGCDYDADAFRSSLSAAPGEGGEAPDEMDGEADAEDDLLRDIILSIPICLNDINDDVSRVVIACTVYFDDRVIINGQGGDQQETDRFDIEHVIEGEALGSSPYFVDEIAELVVDLDDRADLSLFSHTACELNFGRTPEEAADALTSPELDRSSLDDVYRLAGRDFVFVPVIQYSAEDGAD